MGTIPGADAGTIRIAQDRAPSAGTLEARPREGGRSESSFAGSRRHAKAYGFADPPFSDRRRGLQYSARRGLYADRGVEGRVGCLYEVQWRAETRPGPFPGTELRKSCGTAADE